MPTYTAIPDGDVDAESPGTTTLITLLRDNPIAITEGAAGAPQIVAAAIATDAVETAKIKDLNVTTGKINAFAVTTAKILGQAVTAAKLDTNAVETLKIKDLSVTEAKLALDSVITNKIADGNVTKDKLATSFVHKVLFTDTTEVGNVGSGEDDLMSYTLPGNTMVLNGHRLRITAFFKGNGADIINLKLHFGASAILPSVAASFHTENFSHKVEYDLVRVGSASQRSHLQHYNTLSGLLKTAIINPSETMSGSIIIKFTGENFSDTSDNAIVQQYMQIESIPA